MRSHAASAALGGVFMNVSQRLLAESRGCATSRVSVVRRSHAIGAYLGWLARAAWRTRAVRPPTSDRPSTAESRR